MADRGLVARERIHTVAERKVRVQLVAGGPMVDGMEVPVNESNEKWSEYKLEDGTTIRVKQVVMEVIRSSEYDPEGNPMYAIKAQPIVAIVDVPDNLRRKTN